MQEVTLKLQQYRDLVLRYSAILNLSSPAFLANFTQAIEDSAVYEEFLPDKASIFDLGSGVGLPSIPIAIRRSDLSIILCEIRSKRAAFLQKIVAELRLENVKVFAGDAAKYENEKVDAVIAQSFGKLSDIYKLCRHFLADEASILTIKGPNWLAETEELIKIDPSCNTIATKLNNERFLLITSCQTSAI